MVLRWFLGVHWMVVELHVGSGTVSTCGREVGIRDKVRRSNNVWLGYASGRAESGVGFAAAACAERELTPCRDLPLRDLWHILCRPQPNLR